MSTLSAKEYKCFEDIKRIRPDGSEYWAARELAPVLDYAKWENFYKVIKRAMIACENSGRSTLECFPEVRKTSPMPNGGVKDILDYELSRYACYLIVQNGDPRKEVIALGQTYFAIQTYRQEVADRFNQLDEDIMSCESDLSALLADELWSLVGATANPQAAGFVLEMVKTIRGLGGIAVTSTQGMQDLFGLDGGSYGKGILDASRIKLVMQMEEQEARLIQDKLNLSEDEVRQITRFRRGEGLLCIGYNHVPVAFHTTPKEYEAITTSPTDLRRGRSEHGDE